MSFHGAIFVRGKALAEMGLNAKARQALEGYLDLVPNDDAACALFNSLAGKVQFTWNSDCLVHQFSATSMLRGMKLARTSSTTPLTMAPNRWRRLSCCSRSESRNALKLLTKIRVGFFFFQGLYRSSSKFEIKIGNLGQVSSFFLWPSLSTFRQRLICDLHRSQKPLTLMYSQ